MRCIDVTKITMCGYDCGLCKAYAPNIKKNDQREELSRMWKKYYDLDIPAKNIYCEGCRCEKTDAVRIDSDCPVRKCVIESNQKHCGECAKYSCDTFSQRKGLSIEEAREKAHDDFDPDEYNEYLLAYDNKTRLEELKKSE